MKEFHLIVLRPNAYKHRDSLATLIGANFPIVASGTIEWSREHSFDNFYRFYDKSKKIISSKLAHCGFGMSKFFIIEDSHPSYKRTQTSSGPADVNINVFNLKMMLRKSIGGGHTIHGTNSCYEFNKDISFLMGDAGVSLIKSGDVTGLPTSFGDPVGVQGWSSLRSFFNVLQYHSQYVVLRNFQELPDNLPSEDHNDIDLLVEDMRSCYLLLNGTKVYGQFRRVHYSTVISDSLVYFDLRSTDSRYYDKHWSRDILTQSVERNGIFIPDEINHKYSLLYHALVHKRKIADDYLVFIASLFDSKDFERDGSSKTLLPLLGSLDLFMKQHGYSYSLPNDLSVYYNWKIRRIFASFSLLFIVLRVGKLIAAFTTGLLSSTRK